MQKFPKLGVVPGQLCAVPANGEIPYASLTFAPALAGLAMRCAQQPYRPLVLDPLLHYRSAAVGSHHDSRPTLIKMRFTLLIT